MKDFFAMRRNKIRQRNALLLVLVPFFLLLSACGASGERNSDDIVTLPEVGDEIEMVQAIASSQQKNLATPKVVVPSDIGFDLWWRFVGSDELEMLVDRAVVNSQTLQIAAQRVVQAKASSIQAGASSLPELQASTGYTVSAPRGGLGSVAKGSSPKISDGAYNLDLDATYTVDLWGGRASLSQSADLKLKRAIYQYDAELLSLVTSLSKSYLTYLSLNDRIANAQESEQALASMLAAMEDLYARGDATVVELQMQRSSVFDSRILLPSLLLQRQKLEHQIARLVGVAPGELNLSGQGLSSIQFPADVRNISSNYILRRPDVRAIEAALFAAEADLDVARASLFPALTLSAGVGFGSSNFDELFQPHTLMWNFIAGLSATIFDGGRKEQQIKYSQAVRAEIVESYVFTVYGGLQKVKDALADLEYSEDKLQMQRVSTDASRIAYEFGFESYRVGGIDFLTFLDSMHTYQKRRDELFVYDLEYYQAFIDFYSALGGGIAYRGVGKEANPELNSANISAGAQVYQRNLGWLPQPERVERDDWLVRLSGVYDRFSVEAMLRDLSRRYTDLSPVKELFAERIGFSQSEHESGEAWYAISATGFSSRDAAVSWCDKLRKTQQRCVIYQAEDSFEVEGRFTLQDAINEGQKQRLAALAAVRKPAASQPVQAANPLNIDKTKEEHGRAYSLLNTEDGKAWLIGNNSYRVWQFSTGDALHYSGQVKSIDGQHVVVSFDGRDYLLKPIYYLEAIEASQTSEPVAKLRWGGRSGKVFYYKVGDKVYGNGVVEAISKQAIVINWKGFLVSLMLDQKSR